jgi:hypothetical protein
MTPWPGLHSRTDLQTTVQWYSDRWPLKRTATRMAPRPGLYSRGWIRSSAAAGLLLNALIDDRSVNGILEQIRIHNPNVPVQSGRYAEVNTDYVAFRVRPDEGAAIAGVPKSG